MCITGEGRCDTQSLAGKTPIGVARVCAELNVPCVLVAGSVEAEARAASAALIRSCLALDKIAQAGEESYRDVTPLLTRAGRKILST